jgi:TonB-dependent starch-binding outer membrane protein SusC
MKNIFQNKRFLNFNKRLRNNIIFSIPLQSLREWLHLNAVKSNRSKQKHMKKLLLFMSFVLSALVAGAQERVVTGKVTAADDGQPIPGANILVKGTSTGTSSSSDGQFSIAVGNNSTLVISYIGYATQEVIVGDRTILDITLQTDITSLNEIVVIGYGQVEKKDLTGSVVSVNASTFNKGVMMSPTDLIMGKVAGVQVTAPSGAPGSGSQILIRGGSSVNANNAPLIVVDGFPLDNNGIAGSGNRQVFINPNDIESVTVLKDASATAIYGSRASNGVIIYTTKKGASGKMQIGFNGQVSISQPTKYVDVLSGNQFRALTNSLSGSYGIDSNALNRLGDSNTDWQKEIYRTAVSQDYNISLSGSKNDIPYRISYGFTDQQGILKTTKMNRQSLNLNVSPSFLNDALRVNASLKGMYGKTNFGDQGAVGAAVTFDPTQPIRNGNTRYGGYYTWVADPNDPNSAYTAIAPRNPIAMLDLTDNQSNVLQAIGNIKIDYRMPFLKELVATANMGMEISDSKGFNNVSTLAPWTSELGSATKYTGKTKSRLFDFYLNYAKEVNEHKFDVIGGYSYQSFERDGTNFSKAADGSIFYDYELNGEGKEVPRVFVPNPNYLVSFFGRLNYTMLGKYYLTATYRADGSSRFAKENRWGSFPAVALGWRLTDEDFMSAIPFISNFKVRAGYGITGQQDVGGTYPYLPTYLSSTTTAQYQFGNTFYDTYRPSPYDAAFKWEETVTKNIGVDFGIWKGRISGSVDYYQRTSKDLINTIPIPAGSNFSNFLLTNVGDMVNDGIEITLSADIIKKGDFEWTLSGNFAHNQNEITRLLRTTDANYTGNNVGGIAGGVGNFIQNDNVGYPRNSFYVFQQIYGSNGMPVEGFYVDRTGDGGSVASNVANKYRNHSPQPRILMGLTTSLRYKSFDLFMAGRANIDNYVYNNGASNTFYQAAWNGNSNSFNNLRSYIYDTEFASAQYWSDIYVQNASFFKMDNMTVGYSNSDLLGQKIKARFSFTVQNAFMITKYKGIDPEVGNGIDNNLYPRPRVFLLGVNLTY